MSSLVNVTKKKHGRSYIKVRGSSSYGFFDIRSVNFCKNTTEYILCSCYGFTKFKIPMLRVLQNSRSATEKKRTQFEICIVIRTVSEKTKGDSLWIESEHVPYLNIIHFYILMIRSLAYLIIGCSYTYKFCINVHWEVIQLLCVKFRSRFIYIWPLRKVVLASWSRSSFNRVGHKLMCKIVSLCVTSCIIFNETKIARKVNTLLSYDSN